MWRRSSCGVFVGLVFAGALLGGETSGKFVKFNATKKELTISHDGADVKYILTDDVKVTTSKGEPARKGIMSFANPRVAKPGALLTVVTSKKGDEEVVTEIRLGGKSKP